MQFKRNDLCRVVSEGVLRWPRDENKNKVGNFISIPLNTIVEIISAWGSKYFVWIPTLNMFSSMHAEWIAKL